MKPTIPHLTECLAYIEQAGWTYSHKSSARTYVFYRNSDLEELAFTLTEIRDAFKHGF